MKRKIFLHGYLADLHPEPIPVESETVSEAVRILETIPALQPEGPNKHAVEIDGVVSEVDLYAVSDMEEIHIRPQAGGAGGRGGLLQIVIGVAIIAVALTFPASLPTLGGLLTQGTYVMAGAMMVLGGVMQMMYQVPETEGDEARSNYISADGNTVKIGTAIPVLVGTYKVYGHYLSFDVDTKKVQSTGSSYGSANPDTGEYISHDDLSVPDGISPVRPVFSSDVHGATNTPTSGWDR